VSAPARHRDSPVRVAGVDDNAVAVREASWPNFAAHWVSDVRRVGISARGRRRCGRLPTSATADLGVQSTNRHRDV